MKLDTNRDSAADHRRRVVETRDRQHTRLIELIRKKGEMSLPEIKTQLYISIDTARTYVTFLVNTGKLVRRQADTKAGERGPRYSLAPQKEKSGDAD